MPLEGNEPLIVDLRLVGATQFDAGMTGAADAVTGMGDATGAAAAIADVASSALDRMAVATDRLAASAVVDANAQKAQTDAIVAASAAQRRANELLIASREASMARSTEQAAADASFVGQLNAKSAAMAGFGRSMTRNVTTPLLAVGGAAAFLGGSFDRNMLLIETQAGAPVGEVKRLHDAVLSLSGSAVTQSPNELAQGLFHLESIGLRGSKAIDTLKTSAEGAMVGMGDLEQTTTALGSAMLVDIKGAGDDATKTMGILNAAIGAGNMHMDDMTLALGTGMLPAFKNANLGIVDAVGALALFTDEGYQSSSAAAQISTALHFLTNPSEKAATALKGVGLSQDALAVDMTKPRGLLTALTDLHDHLDGLSAVQRTQVLGDILPGGRGRILLTLLNQLDRYQSKMDQIEHTQGRFGDAVKQTNDNDLVNLEKAWRRLERQLIPLGTKILPELIPVVKQLGNAVHDGLQWFDHLSPSTQKWIIKGALMLAVAGPLVGMVGKLGKGVGGAAGALEGLGTALGLGAVEMGVVIGVVAVLAFGIYELWKHHKQLEQGAVQAWGAVKGAVGDAVGGVKHLIGDMKSWVIAEWDGMVNHLVDGLNHLNFTMPQVDTHIPGVGKVGGFDIGPRLHHVGGGGGVALAGAGGPTVRPVQTTNRQVQPRNFAATSYGAVPLDVTVPVHIDGQKVAEANARVNANRKARQ